MIPQTVGSPLRRTEYRGFARGVSLLTVSGQSPQRAKQDRLNRPKAGFSKILPEMIDEWVRAAPDRCAVCFQDRTLSYAALDGRVNKLARRLIQIGVRAETVVGLCADPGLGGVIGLLAILKAGGAFLPLDPTWPEERVATMIAATDMKILVRGPDAPAFLSKLGKPGLMLDAHGAIDGDRLSENAMSADLPPSPPSQLAYVMFTSGSTGEAKGVAITHGALAHRMRWSRDRYPLTEEDVLVALASGAFDIAVWERTAPLIAGARLRLVGPGDAKDLFGLTRLMRRTAVSVMHCVPSLLSALLEEPELRRVASLRQIFCGGEALQPETASNAARVLPKVALEHWYGPTETTISVTAWSCRARARTIPIGSPIPGVSIEILGSGGEPVRVGEAGELFVGGPVLARGYFGRPDLTALCFLPDPRGSGSRRYRTGDKARVGEDGALLFLGRIDRQFKLRGVRIEPEEIESALRRIPTIQAAMVRCERTGADGGVVIAYLVRDPGSPRLDEERVRAALLERLPAIMAPSAFIELDSIPLDHRGKVDFGSLPRPSVGATDGRPFTLAETRLANLWTAVLGRRVGSVADRFFSLGGQSLAGMRLLSKIRQEWGVALAFNDLFVYSSLGAMAGRIENERAKRGEIDPRTGRDSDRMSHAQKRLWFMQRLDPESAAYHIPAVARLVGKVDESLMARAAIALVERHESLRARFPMTAGGAPVRRITRPELFPLPFRKIVTGDESEAWSQIERETRVRFDLETGPLIRLVLLRWRPRQRLLLLVVHHIIADGASLKILFRDLAAFYRFFSGESSTRPTPLSIDVNRSWSHPADGEQALGLDWWANKLAGLPAELTLPRESRRLSEPVSSSGFVDFTLENREMEALLRYCRNRETTPFIVLASVYANLLARYSGQNDICFGAPFANRLSSETESLVDMLVDTLVIRVGLGPDKDGSPRFSTVVGRVHEAVLAAIEYRHVPFEAIVNRVRAKDGHCETPIFQTVFGLETEAADARRAAFRDFFWEWELFERGSALYSLTLDMVLAGEMLSGSLKYRSDHHARQTMIGFAAHFRNFLRVALETPEIRIEAVDFLDEVERVRMIEQWNETDRHLPDTNLHALIADVTSKTPDATALVSEHRVITYAALDARAEALAGDLRRQGFRHGRPAGILLESSTWMTAAILATLKCGGFYVVLDPDNPPNRLARLVSDSGLDTVLTRSEIRGRTPDLVQNFVDVDRTVADSGVSEVCPDVGATDLVCLIYTSGTTGRPKGVVIQHRNAVRLVRAMDAFPLAPGAGFAQAANPTFDVFSLEVWTALARGHRLCILNKQTLLSPRLLERELVRRRIAFLVLTTALFHQLARERPGLFKALRFLMFGGEAVDPEVVRLVRRHGKPEFLINAYGPAENTTVSTWRIIDVVEEQGVPIGKPVANARAYVLDRRLRPTPVRVTGELCLAGAGLAAGYFGRPRLTARSFAPDPFARGEDGGLLSGERLYRSGDLARFRHDGHIEFIGRIDRQLKLRGFRIEPEEIERVLTSHKEVGAAAVCIEQPESGDRRLAAFIAPVAGTDAAGLTARVFAYLRANLPAFMVPASLSVLAALPLTRHGKLDRKALPKPDRIEAEFSEPQTPTESRLTAIWSEILAVKNVGRDNHFFELGGHSLLAIRLAQRVGDVFGVELPLKELFASGTVSAVASVIDRLKAAGSVIEPVAPIVRSGKKVFPLSNAQARLWFLERLTPGRPTYHIPVVYQIDGRLDVSALSSGFRALAKRHHALGARIVEEDGQPFCRTGAAACLSVIDWPMFSDANRETGLLAEIADLVHRPFRVDGGALFQLGLFRLTERRCYLLVHAHHLILDGASLHILFEQLSLVYGAMLFGRTIDLPAPRIQYGDYALWQRRMSGSAASRQQLVFWQKYLAGAARTFNASTDYPRPPIPRHEGARFSMDLNPAARSALASLTHTHSVTPFVVSLAVFGVLLCRFADQNGVSIGAPAANREQAETKELIGLLVNTLVYRVDVDPACCFKDLLGRLREDVLAVLSRQSVPFDRVVERVQPDRERDRTPLFQVFFSWEEAGLPEINAPGIRGLPREVELRAAKFDLSFYLARRREAVSLTVEYDRELFKQETAVRLADHFQTLLQNLNAYPNRAIAEIDILTVEEKKHALRLAQGPNRRKPGFRAIPELIEHQARESPERVAVMFGDLFLSYAVFQEQVNGLAALLPGYSPNPEAPIAILMERSLEMVIGLAAVLRAGRAYLPLDPDRPTHGLRFMLEDAAPELVLGQDRLGPRVAEMGVRVLVLDVENRRAADENRDFPMISPAQIAYLIYTSGSTGRPKPVANTHAGIANRLAWMTDLIRLGADDHVLQKTPYIFDVSVWEFFWPLIAGSRLTLARPGLHGDPRYLARIMETRAISVVHFVPSMLDVFIAAHRGERFHALKCVVCSGETLDRLTVEGYCRKIGAPLFNLYGPTEAGVEATLHRVLPDDPRGFVPIGRPAPGVRVQIVDALLNPVPIGFPGEIVIGGVQVALGYPARPDLTAEKFTPSAFGPEPGSRLYRTGDRGICLADGEIRFLGRRDRQVKLHGYRIELEEIQTVLRRAPGVADALVVMKKVGDDLALIGYVVKRTGRRHAERGSHPRAFLITKLPRYMVPEYWVFLERFPLLPNGKLNRAALPEPELERESGSIRPRGPIEASLHELWRAVLKSERIGVRDNFFRIGGHSLAAIRVLAGIHKLFGIGPTLRDFFQNPTIESITAWLIRGERREPSWRIRPVPADIAPLSHEQERLWFLHQIRGDGAYNMPLLIGIEGPLDLVLLERCLARLVKRHASLRTRFTGSERGPVQSIDNELQLPLQVISSNEESVRQDLVQYATRPFKLGSEPPVRLTLFQVKPGWRYLQINCHHIISDGWSNRILYRELALLYSGRQVTELPRLPVRYLDYAVRQRHWSRGREARRQLDFWKQSLEPTVASLSLPNDFARPSGDGGRGARIRFQLEQSSMDAFDAAIRREGVTRFMGLMGLYAWWLHRYAGQETVQIGTPVSNRNAPEIEGVVGLFVNSLTLRFSLNEVSGLTELWALTRKIALNAFENQEIPFDLVVRGVQARRDPGRTPLFQTLFAFDDAPLKLKQLGEVRFSVHELDWPFAKFDLAVYLTREDDRIAGVFEYNTDLFGSETAARMAHHFKNLVRHAAANPSCRLKKIPFMDGRERQRLLSEWSKRASGFAAATTLDGLLASLAESEPDRAVIVTERAIITLGFLEQSARDAASCMVRHGIGPETPVGLCLPRSPEWIILMLAILKTGGCYVPILSTADQEPAPPSAETAFRLKSMIRDVRLQWLIADRDPAPDLNVSRLSTDEILRKGGFPETIAAHHVENLAYLMFTSGSTGKPKAVAITHRNVLRLVEDGDVSRACARQRTLHAAPAAFDAATFEIWGSLLNAGALVLAPVGVTALPSFIRRARIQNLWLTSQLFEWFVDRHLDDLDQIRTLWAGGDVLSPIHVRRFLARRPETRLMNGYGPTEGATFTCAFDLVGFGDRAPSVPIGRPLSGRRIYVVDRDGELAPFGVAGELWIAGDGLARGYANRPDLTAARFAPDPFVSSPGERVYRSGDLCRFRDNGVIEFRGRIDRQLKIRGYRVEPGEIEALLMGFSGVNYAAVVPVERVGTRVLAALMVIGPDRDWPEFRAALAEYARARLPEYMTPAVWLALDEPPLNRNGKPDRDRLQRIAQSEAADSHHVKRSPNTELEKIIAEAWGRVLGLGRLDVHTPFFELGGHSLAMIRVREILTTLLEREIPLVHLLEYATIAGLARFLGASDPTTRPARPTRRAALRKNAISRKSKFEKNL